MEPGTGQYIEGINDLNLQPLSYSSEQRGWLEEWRPTSPKSLQMQADTSESPIYADGSGSLSMNQEVCMILGHNNLELSRALPLTSYTSLC